MDLNIVFHRIRKTLAVWIAPATEALAVVEKPTAPTNAELDLMRISNALAHRQDQPRQRRFQTVGEDFDGEISYERSDLTGGLF